jgi:hypothetical protein
MSCKRPHSLEGSIFLYWTVRLGDRLVYRKCCAILICRDNDSFPFDILWFKVKRALARHGNCYPIVLHYPMSHHVHLSASTTGRPKLSVHSPPLLLSPFVVREHFHGHFYRAMIGSSMLPLRIPDSTTVTPPVHVLDRTLPHLMCSRMNSAKHSEK